jgi:hypothetical protein
MTKPTIFKIRQAPKAYKLDPEKLKGASQSILPYLFGSNLHYSEDFEYFDVIKPYLDIPEKPKTLDEIKQEFDEKIDKLIETTKWNFAVSKERTEYHYDKKFSRIIQDFEYAKENGNFPLKLNLAYTTTGLSAGSYAETSFVIKQGNKHEGYYTIGNQRYFRYYMNDKPNVIVRFFMKTCLGFVWVDE